MSFIRLLFFTLTFIPTNLFCQISKSPFFQNNNDFKVFAEIQYNPLGMPGENSDSKNLSLKPNYTSQSYYWGIGLGFKNIEIKYGRLNNHYQPADILINQTNESLKYVPYLRYRFRTFGFSYNHEIKENTFISFGYDFCIGKDKGWNSVPRSITTTSYYTASVNEYFKTEDKKYSVYHNYNYLYGVLKMNRFSLGISKTFLKRLTANLNFSYQSSDRALYENNIIVFDNNLSSQVGNYHSKSKGDFFAVGVNLKYSLILKEIKRSQEKDKLKTTN